jgi:hypothetical protein
MTVLNEKQEKYLGKLIIELETEFTPVEIFGLLDMTKDVFKWKEKKFFDDTLTKGELR